MSKNQIPKLSQLLEAGDGYLLEAALESAKEYAIDLQTSDRPLDATDKEWLVDYIENIQKAVTSNLELDKKVAERATQETISPEQASSPREMSTFGSPTIQERRAMTGTVAPRPLPNPPSKHNELVYVEKPERFDGKRELARKWLEGYESASMVNGWTHRMMFNYFPTFLTKSASDWYVAIAKPKLQPSSSWPELRKLFLRFYVGPEEKEAIRRELQRWDHRAE